MRALQCAAAVFAALVLTGCTTTITNLTPSSLPRNNNNMYPFEVQFKTAQKSIRENTIQPHVVIGSQTYEMQPAPMLKNRWEAQVPVASTNTHIYYRYKFDYKYDRIPAPGESSRLSPTYQLEITPK